MILRRLTQNLRAQNWTAILIELVIVIVGVFIGTQVANWNEDRLEKRETQRMLARLTPELRNLLALYASSRTYYATTRAYAATALAGWRKDPKVSDRDFVIAAYQASQIYATSTNNATWATIFGADRLRSIDDPVIRDNLAFLMYAASAAATLRAHPQLVEDLRWHTAAIAAFVANLNAFQVKTEMLARRIDAMK